MLKGAQKQMIVIRTRDSRMFEEAYFVIRRSEENSRRGHGDMMIEAHRILEDSLPLPPPPHRRKGITPRWSRLAWFTVGVLLGGGAASLLWLWI